MKNAQGEDEEDSLSNAIDRRTLCIATHWSVIAKLQKIRVYLVILLRNLTIKTHM